MKTQNNPQLDVNTSIGFYMAYFDLLKFFNTPFHAFNYLNERVEKITGKPKYKNFKHFAESRVKVLNNS